MQTITVKNSSDQVIYVLVQDEGVHVTNWDQRQTSDEEQETFVKLGVQMAANLDVAGVAGGGGSIGTETELKERLRKFYDLNTKLAIEWNAFVQAGSVRIKPGKDTTFAVDMSSGRFWISYAYRKDLEVCGPQSSNQKTILITNDGIEKPAEPILEEIKSGDRVTLTLKNDRFLGNPVHDNSFGSVLPSHPIGSVKSDGGKGAHKICSVSGEGSLDYDMEVRIQTVQSPRALAPDLIFGSYDVQDYLEATSMSNKVHYKNKSDETKQKWRMEKNANSHGANKATLRLRDGDEVVFVNMEWNDHVLTYTDENYTGCLKNSEVSKDMKVWVINKA